MWRLLVGQGDRIAPFTLARRLAFGQKADDAGQAVDLAALFRHHIRQILAHPCQVGDFSSNASILIFLPFHTCPNIPREVRRV